MARHRSFGSEFKRHIAKEYLDGRAGLLNWHAGTVCRAI
jgi:hypothetical protein